MLQHYGPQLVNLFAAVLLLLSFAMLSQRRILSLINLYAAQGFVLFLSTALVAWLTGQHHLYGSAALTLALKVIALPVLLGKLALGGALLALIEMLSAKMRIFRAPEFLGTAFLLAVLAMLVHVLLEG